MKNILKFTDDSFSFSAGFEFAKIYSDLEKGLDKINNTGFPVRLCNKENIINACKLHNYTPVFGQVHNGYWINFIAIKDTSNLN